MKRGLIAWDPAELPRSVFEERRQSVGRMLDALGLPALLVYSELWRSNHGRFFSNFMPYFNRALLVIPGEGEMTLLCGLSPRVYRWIRSVTVLDDVRPAGDFAGPLSAIAAERGWKAVGALGWNGFPADLHEAIARSSLEVKDVGEATVYRPGVDLHEVSMRRRSIQLARDALDQELEASGGGPDSELVGRLEGRLRGSGAEDLLILLSDGFGPPRTASGRDLSEGCSVSLALEYKGHWVRISRPKTNPSTRAALVRNLNQALHDLPRVSDDVWVEDLSGAYPFTVIDPEDIQTGSIFALHQRVQAQGRWLFFGDTCLSDAGGIRTL